MDRQARVSTHALYGEGPGPIAPEFIHIEPISERSSRFEWTIAPHSHPGIFQVLLLQSGGGLLASEGVEARLVPPALVLLPSGCVHAFRFDAGAEGWVLSLANDLLGDPRLAPVAAASALAGPRWTGCDAASAARLGWLLADLAGALAGDRSGPVPDRLAAEIALVLATAREALEAGGGGEEAPLGRAALVRRFRQLVEVHFRQGWSVADYARALGASPPTLTRAVRAALGKPPGEAVLDRVLLEAMRCLTYTGASVAQVADELGFADPAYFARFFKARTGMTASAFRRERAWLRQGRAGLRAGAILP